MARWTITRRYTAVRDGRRLGPWQAGDEVDLSDDEAGWVERDSPGLLAEVRPPEPSPASPARAKTPARDRARRGSATRGR